MTRRELIRERDGLIAEHRKLDFNSLAAKNLRERIYNLNSAVARIDREDRGMEEYARNSHAFVFTVIGLGIILLVVIIHIAIKMFEKWIL